MLLRSVVGALVLLLSFQLALNFWQPEADQTLTYSQGNTIRAQRTIYGAGGQSVVFLGSSLTVTLQRYLEQPGVCCLALAGMGVSDGLIILERLKLKPALLLVEIGRLQRKPNRVFLAELLNPPMFELRKYCTAFRHGYQPANLFVPRMERLFKPVAQPEAVDAPRPRRRNPVPSDVEVSRTLDDQRHEVDEAIQNLSDYKEPLDRLRRNGVRVVFYEVPEYRIFTDSEHARRLREAIRQMYPEPAYGWIPIDTGDDYYTYDDQHLCDDDAYAYARYLLHQVRLRGGVEVKALPAYSE